MTLTSHLPAAAVDALRRGRTIEAVKIVRESSGLALKEAHELVQRHVQQMARQASDVAEQVDAADRPAKVGGFVFPPEAANAIARGDVIDAIAQVRRANPGFDLRTAKAAIDDLRGARPNVTSGMPKAQRIPTVVEGDRGNHWLLVIVLIALVLGAAWLTFSPAG